MIGTARGTMLSTRDLQEEVGNGIFVIVDHEMFEVVGVEVASDGHAKVTLEPQFGSAWVLEVAKADYEEPLWEVEGQS